MWLAVAIAACVLCVCLALTNFSNNSKQRLSLIDTVFYIPSCFCQQGKFTHSYEFFLLPSVFPIPVLFFPFLPFWAYLIFTCHSYSSFYAYPCVAIIYWPNITHAWYSHSSIFVTPIHSLLYNDIVSTVNVSRDRPRWPKGIRVD